MKGAKAQARRHKEFSERKESGYATSEAFYRHWDHNLPAGRVLHLLVLDVASGRITDLFEGSAFELPRDAAGNDVYDISPRRPPHRLRARPGRRAVGQQPAGTG